MNRTTQHTHIRTTMDNNEDNDKYINVGDELATADVSMKGVITLRFKDPNKAPIVYDFSESDEDIATREHEEELRQKHMTAQAKRAIRKGDYVTLRELIDEQGLPASAIIPETGRTLLQELCVTGSEEGFAECLRILIFRTADLRGRVAGTNGTILHLLAENGSFIQWDRAVYELGKPLMDDLLLATDNEGNTPLHIAAERGRMDIYTLVAGLCGLESEQSKAKNKHGNKPHELLNANCVELHMAVRARISSEEERQRLKKDPWFRDRVYAEESQRLMLPRMTRYFNNLVHHRPLYTKDETELE